MNEQLRTIIHVAIAAVVGLAIVFELGLPFSKKTAETPDDVVRRGEPLFKDFTDPLEARSLELVKFNDKDGTMKDFRVARIKGKWVIPSEDNYPADAQDRLKEVATTLSDLKPIGYATEVAEDHELFGVKLPKKGETKAGDQGVGELITVQNEKGDDLFKLIVGKEVAGNGDTPSGQRFVRKPEEDVVWVVKFDLSKLPLDFDQWIEKDLLQLNALDVSKVTLKDYNVLSPEDDGRYGVFPRMDATIAWDTEKGAWQLDQLVGYTPNVSLQQNKPIPDGLSDQEELNKQKLDDLKSALDDLKIVNVERKPPGIDADLKVRDRAAQSSLVQMGFFPFPRTKDQVELLSANGEVIVDMKDGVQYVLRFGNRVDEADALATKNRYLLASAQLGPEMLTPPKLEPEPAGPEAPAPNPPKEDWEDKKKKATNRVNELNSRFADWYYVISEDVYKKIHLSRSDIIKESTGAKDEGFGIDAFRKLESDGIQQTIPSSPPPGGARPGGFNPDTFQGGFGPP